MPSISTITLTTIDERQHDERMPVWGGDRAGRASDRYRHAELYANGTHAVGSRPQMQAVRGRGCQ